MRNKVFSTAVHLARNLCMSQSRPSSIVWGLVAAPASAGQSCILALDARRPDALCRPDSRAVIRAIKPKGFVGMGFSSVAFLSAGLPFLQSCFSPLCRAGELRWERDYPGNIYRVTRQSQNHITNPSLYWLGLTQGTVNTSIIEPWGSQHNQNLHDISSHASRKFRDP
jgi:hypothetical protein